MSFGDSLLIALFGLAVVFSALILLSLLVKLQSLVLAKITTGRSKTDPVKTQSNGEKSDLKELIKDDTEQWTAGELKLIGVDEKTAAMIMAIVSDECQIPLSELQFKSIKAIN